MVAGGCVTPPSRRRAQRGVPRQRPKNVPNPLIFLQFSAIVKQFSSGSGPPAPSPSLLHLRVRNPGRTLFPGARGQGPGKRRVPLLACPAVPICCRLLTAGQASSGTQRKCFYSPDPWPLAPVPWWSLPRQGPAGGHRQQIRPQRLQRPRTDAGDPPPQVLVVDKPPARLAAIDDAVRSLAPTPGRLANSGQSAWLMSTWNRAVCGAARSTSISRPRQPPWPIHQPRVAESAAATRTRHRRLVGAAKQPVWQPRRRIGPLAGHGTISTMPAAASHHARIVL